MRGARDKSLNAHRVGSNDTVTDIIGYTPKELLGEVAVRVWVRQ